MFNLQAFAKEQKLKYAKHAVARTWRTPRKALVTAPQVAIARSAFVVIKSSQPKLKGSRIVQMSASVALRLVSIATKSLLYPKKLKVSSVAQNAFTSKAPQPDRAFCKTRGTFWSRFQKVRRRQKSTEHAAATGCLNIAGSCNKNLAER
jgi:hypothetical protein